MGTGFLSILTMLFGLLALARIPIQMTPAVEEPQVSVETFWPGASPLEVEREIVDPQEEQLKSLEGLVRLESSSADARSTLTLTFVSGTDLDAALLRVANRLQQVPDYPSDAERPVLRSVGAEAQPFTWLVLVPGGDDPFTGDISTLPDLVEDTIRAEIERVPGVAATQSFGERPHELQVVVDPARLAARQVSLGQLSQALERENRNVSGGDFGEGKRRYVVRTVSAYEDPAAVEDVVVGMRGGVPIYVRDVATVRMGFRKPEARGYLLGEPMVAVSVVRQSGANVMDVMTAVDAVVTRLNDEVLGPRGLTLRKSYDETVYIGSAIDLVRQSLALGAVLAIVVLLLFLRSRTSTLVIAVAIPISIIGTFLMLLLLGRTLNVISLAGLAFAVGMVVDNSIVVLENIFRHRQRGASRAQAAFEGAREVWGAVLASTLTTIAVFVPILFVRGRGRAALPRHRASPSRAARSALSLLVVAITVIPSLSAKVLDVAGTEETARARLPGGSSGAWCRPRGARSRRGNRQRRSVGCWRARGLPAPGGHPRPDSVGAVLRQPCCLIPKAEYLPLGNTQLHLRHGAPRRRATTWKRW